MCALYTSGRSTLPPVWIALIAVGGVVSLLADLFGVFAAKRMREEDVSFLYKKVPAKSTSAKVVAMT